MKKKILLPIISIGLGIIGIAIALIMFFFVNKNVGFTSALKGLIDFSSTSILEIFSYIVLFLSLASIVIGIILLAKKKPQYGIISLIGIVFGSASFVLGGLMLPCISNILIGGIVALTLGFISIIVGIVSLLILKKEVIVTAEPDPMAEYFVGNASMNNDPDEDEEEKPIEKKKAEKKAEIAEETEEKQPSSSSSSNGKYEVFPEAGFYKYRLKANNGTILLVSNSYTSQAGAIAGIETLKKNVKVGTHKVITDKNNRGQFRIYTANDSRLVVSGEVYQNAQGAENALNSVLRFFDNDNIVKLDSIPEKEHREWRLENLPEPTQSLNGRIELSLDEDDKWVAKLYASNGELLFMSTTYSSKTALLNGLKKVSENAFGGNISVIKDKSKKYQFKVFSPNGMVLVLGEMYSSFDGARNAAISMRNFLKGEPKQVDMSK